MNKARCHKHGIQEGDEQWTSALGELVSGEDDHIEPFSEQVCPLCYLNLRSRYRKARRQLKGESKQAIRLRGENGHYRKVVDAVCETIKEITGQDPRAFEGQVFPRATEHAGVPENVVSTSPERVGDLVRILPNLITEIANKKSE